jgi:hypothetical protein
MKHPSLLAIVAFIAGLGIGYFARSAFTGTLQRRTHAADLAAIEKQAEQPASAAYRAKRGCGCACPRGRATRVVWESPEGAVLGRGGFVCRVARNPVTRN